MVTNISDDQLTNNKYFKVQWKHFRIGMTKEESEPKRYGTNNFDQDI